MNLFHPNVYHDTLRRPDRRNLKLDYMIRWAMYTIIYPWLLSISLSPSTHEYKIPSATVGILFISISLSGIVIIPATFRE